MNEPVQTSVALNFSLLNRGCPHMNTEPKRHRAYDSIRTAVALGLRGDAFSGINRLEGDCTAAGLVLDALSRPQQKTAVIFRRIA